MEFIRTLAVALVVFGAYLGIVLLIARFVGTNERSHDGFRD